MLFLLSPAKKLVEGSAEDRVPATQPVMLEDTEILLETTRELSSEALQDLMGISQKLGDLNHQRFQDFELPFTEDNARQAALMFDGDVYRGLDAPSLSDDDLTWAQDHVVILSGLYGALRPLDLMQPYRLEMGTRLETLRGKDLYTFWGSRISEQLNDWLSEEGVVINLASNEYNKAVDRKALNARWITPQFKDISKGKPRVISFYAKKARGAMTRWAIEHRVTDPEQLKDCDAMGYTFDDELSEGDTWVFTRPKPPPKS